MITTNALPAAPSRVRLITLWTLSGLVALAFLGAGGAKLAGVPVMVEMFGKVGLGQWFRYFTGLLEVAGRNRPADVPLRILRGRPACHRHGWRNHRRGDGARRLARPPGCAARSQRNHRLFAQVLS